MNLPARVPLLRPVMSSPTPPRPPSDTSEELRRLFDLSLDLLCIAGFDGYFRLVNPAWERTLGYSREELLSRPYLEFVHPEDRDATTLEAARLSSGDHTFSFENRYICKDGSVKWLLWNAFTSAEQQLVYAAARDITERKLSERQVRAYTAELEQARQTDRERSEELAQMVRELEAAKAAAEEATRAKSEFLAHMSHEVRTPMSAILGMTDLALGTALTEEQREYIATVKEAAAALLKLVSDALDVSRIEARRMELERVDFSLAEVIEGVLRVSSVRAQEKGLALRWTAAPGVPPFLVGDPTRLRQVLLNLVGNAVKFSPHGAVAVEVEAESVEGGQARLRFAVRDQGPGIPAEEQEHIFEPFAQADGRHQHSGSGLGLTICAQLVSLMGGRIWVESTPGQGSVFQFTAEFAVAAGVPPPATRASSAAVLRERRLRILLVEDTHVIQTLILRMLGKCGHAVVLANNGREALAVLQNENFDLVLMDVEMPGMDGLETAALIREQERDTPRHIPIIAMTAHADPGDRHRCLRAGMDAYLPKPVEMAELLQTIEELAPRPAPGRREEETAEPLLDRASLLEGVGGDARLLRQLVRIFLDDSPGLLHAVRAAIDAREPDTLRKTAHALKGATGHFSRHGTYDVALTLERMGQRGDFAGVEEVFVALEKQLFRLARTLTVLQKNL